MQKNLTKGNIFFNILSFSVPYLISYFLQTLYGLADLFITGQFNGADTITAVSAGSQVMHMLTVMIVGLAMGTTVLISQAVGGNRPEHISKAIGNTISMFMLLSVLFTIMLLAAVPGIVTLMSTPAESVDQTRIYLRICFAGIPCITAYNVISSVFRGMGDSKSPMYFIAVSCVVNIVLDYILIGIFRMGAAGAALGTICSQTASVLLAMIFICKKNMGISLEKKDFKPDANMLGRILKIGVPVALQDGFIQISFLVITVIANQRGVNVAAGVGIVEKIIGVLFLIPSTMMSSVSAIAAQNNGAGEHGRARKTLHYGILISISFGVLFTIICEFYSVPLISLFAKETAVIELGSQYLRSYVFDCIAAGIHFCFSGYFCAYNYSYLSFLHNIISIICVRIPGAYLASLYFPDNLFPMGAAAPLGSLLSAVICLLMYLRISSTVSKMEPVQKAIGPKKGGNTE